MSMVEVYFIYPDMALLLPDRFIWNVRREHRIDGRTFKVEHSKMSGDKVKRLVLEAAE